MTATATANSGRRAPSGLQNARRGSASPRTPDRDQDQVVEQDRPAGDEAPQLVERVAREHRRAAALLVQRGALDVGHRGQDEEHAADRKTTGVSPSAWSATTPSEK